MIDRNKQLFPLGRTLATPGALDALERAGQSPLEFIKRHVTGDWGDELDEQDKALNDQAIENGSRIISAYRTSNGDKLWIITEAADSDGNRAVSTILLPSEY